MLGSRSSNPPSEQQPHRPIPALSSPVTPALQLAACGQCPAAKRSSEFSSPFPPLPNTEKEKRRKKENSPKARSAPADTERPKARSSAPSAPRARRRQPRTHPRPLGAPQRPHRPRGSAPGQGSARRPPAPRAPPGPGPPPPSARGPPDSLPAAPRPALGRGRGLGPGRAAQRSPLARPRGGPARPSAHCMAAAGGGSGTGSPRGPGPSARLPPPPPPARKRGPGGARAPRSPRSAPRPAPLTSGLGRPPGAGRRGAGREAAVLLAAERRGAACLIPGGPARPGAS